jgi:hypothetical protein
VIGDTASEHELTLIERVRPFRPKRQAEQLITGRRVNRQHGAIALRPNQIPELPWLNDRARVRVFEVVDDRDSVALRNKVLNLQPGGQRFPLVRSGLYDDLASSIKKRERQAIVGEHGRGDLRDLRKDLPNIEDR